MKEKVGTQEVESAVVVDPRTDPRIRQFSIVQKSDKEL